MSNTEKTWLSAHLYHTGNWENFLTRTLSPFVDSIIEKKQTEQFFFIRYWERGPHIRLRLKGKKNILENAVKPELETCFKNYFQKNPSQREEPDWAKNLPTAQSWLPNDSVQFIAYEQETERYGGDKAIMIAEKQFEASSRAVLSILKESPGWDYDRAMGAAIQMHLSFAYAMGMDIAEANFFYSGVFLSWLRMVYNWTPEQAVEQPEQREKIINAFEENFEKQKPALLPFHKTLWEALEEEAEFEQQWLNQWIQDMKMICSGLKEIQNNHQLIIPEYVTVKKEWDIPAERQQLWFLYGSYVHMTNNRLGILNRDEAYLGYLIKRSLETLYSETVKT